MKTYPLQFSFPNGDYFYSYDSSKSGQDERGSFRVANVTRYFGGPNTITAAQAFDLVHFANVTEQVPPMLKISHTAAGTTVLVGRALVTIEHHDSAVGWSGWPIKESWSAHFPDGSSSICHNSESSAISYAITYQEDVNRYNV